ncbi:gp58-like family protein, partial [Streptococcus parasanguinis]|uniref:gp58-like family protein n=2 Tax=Streptococcus parasanguinis TaxID=1318 RepID=UPI00066D59F8
WYNKPDDKEHKIGDIWFEKNGLYDRMYVWNGSQWEKRIDTEDVDKIKKEVDKQLEQAKQSTAIEIEKANAKAQEALVKAGTIPDASKLSDQIKTLILNSPDLSRKVTETFNNADNGDTIYSKIVSKVATNFATTAEVSGVYDRVNNLSDKIAKQTVEFNKLTESNKLYERILGTSETGAPDQLSRLVMSSQIFQTEVGKYSTTGGPNMLRNSRADDGLKYWTEANGRLNFTAHQFYLNGQKRMFSLRPGAFVHSPRFIIKQNTNYMLNLIAFDANTARFKIAFCKRRKGSTNDFDEMQIIFDKTGSPAFNSERAVKKSFSFNTGAFDEGYLLFNYQGNPNGWSGLFMTELDFYEGSSDRLWQPSPDDSAEPIEAVRTQVSQLAGSWSVKNLSSAGDVLNSINLLANGTNLIDGRLTHITGQTVIDNAVIEDGMIANVSANKVTAGTIDAREVNLINLNAKSVTSGTFKGLTFEGGIIRGNYGNTVINLNSNVTTYNGTAKIEFMSPQNSLEFNSGGRKAFLSPTISNGTNYAAFAFGVNDRGVMDPNANFTGLKIFNQYGHRKVVLIGDVHIVKDSVSNNAPSTSLADIFRYINENFKALQRFRGQNGEGYPGFYDISL